MESMYHKNYLHKPAVVLAFINHVASVISPQSFDRGVTYRRFSYTNAHTVGSLHNFII